MMIPAEEIAVAGNGGLEVICWLVMACALPGASGERLFYEAIAP